ncbi:MAG TPA: o-succinylbenzoate--CoA ligase [Actinomycetes bacterium]|nr:o-succinylbenzoate--CoA ligase [Actinomycetes bacterium]
MSPVGSVAGAVELLDAPVTPAEVERFLPRLARSLNGGAPVMTLPRGGPERLWLVDAVTRSGGVLPWDAALVVPTTGSTGTPRLAVLSRSALTASADLTHRALGGPGRWLLALPTTHIAGLQVLVRSLRSGLEPTVLDTRETFSVGSFVAAVQALDISASEHPHYTALVPTQLQRLLDDGAGVESLWQLDAVLVGGAAMSPRLLARARDAGVTVVRTYGMTETCGGCVYDGEPLAGVAISIGPDGRIRLRGPMLFDGYLGDGTAEWVDGWLVTNDVGRLVDGRLTVDGRVDHIINSGGVKVPAEAVEQALLELPFVEQAVVVGLSDDEWGKRVVAVVTPASDVSGMRDAVRGRLPDEWLPREVVGVDALPWLAPGKVDREAVRRIAGDLAR